MYRPVHGRRSEHAHKMLSRAGYAGGGEIDSDDSILPDTIGQQEPATPGIAPKPLPAPISTHRRLGRRAMKKLRP